MNDAVSILGDKCPACRGKGEVRRQCNTCAGTGRARGEGMLMSYNCPDCDNLRCRACGGSGKRIVQVKQ